MDEVLLAVLLAEDVAVTSRSAEVADCSLLSAALKLFFQVEILELTKMLDDYRTIECLIAARLSTNRVTDDSQVDDFKGQS